MKTRFYLSRNIKSITRTGSKLGDRKMLVEHRTGAYTIEQLDRDYYEVNGPHLTQFRVKGWADGLRMIDCI